MTDLTVIALRALSFVASLQAAGIPLFLWLFGDGVPHVARPVTTLARRTALVALVLVISYQLVEPARLWGDELKSADPLGPSVEGPNALAERV